MASVIARTRIERLGRHDVIHAIVEILGRHLRLLGRKIAILRIFADLGIAQPPQRAVLVAHDRAEMLEAGAAERGFVREKEIAAPETLARDRSVRLGVDGQEDARRAVRFRHAAHQHQHMAVGVGIDRARAQRLLCQRHGVEIGVVVARAHGAGMDDVADVAQIFAEIRRALRLRRSAPLRAELPAARPAARGQTSPAAGRRLPRRRSGGWPAPIPVQAAEADA